MISLRTIRNFEKNNFIKEKSPNPLKELVISEKTEEASVEGSSEMIREFERNASNSIFRSFFKPDPITQAFEKKRKNTRSLLIASAEHDNHSDRLYNRRISNEEKEKKRKLRMKKNGSLPFINSSQFSTMNPSGEQAWTTQKNLKTLLLLFEKKRGSSFGSGSHHSKQGNISEAGSLNGPSQLLRASLAEATSEGEEEMVQEKKFELKFIKKESLRKPIVLRKEQKTSQNFVVTSNNLFNEPGGGPLKRDKPQNSQMKHKKSMTGVDGNKTPSSYQVPNPKATEWISLASPKAAIEFGGRLGSGIRMGDNAVVGGFSSKIQGLASLPSSHGKFLRLSSTQKALNSQVQKGFSPRKPSNSKRAGENAQNPFEKDAKQSQTSQIVKKYRLLHKNRSTFIDLFRTNLK